MRRHHGVMLPSQKTGVAPARVVNIRSKRNLNKVNNRIRLDKLLRSVQPKILIKRRLGGIGDVIMTTPLLKAIKELIPNCHLTYSTDTKYANGALEEVILHNPYVDKLIPNERVRDADYDYVADVTTTGLDRERSGTIPPNRIDMFAQEVGVDVSSDPQPVYIVTQEEREAAIVELDNLISNRKTKKVIAIQARSNDARRTWPLDYVQQLCEILIEDENTHILLMDWAGTVDRWKTTDSKIHLVMDRSIADTAAIIQQSDVVVCPDSSILHLAGALNKKIITIFGPIPPESRINHYPNATAVCLQLSCQFCWYVPKCANNTNIKMECLVNIKPLQVKDAIIKKLKEPMQTQKHIIYGHNLTNKGQDPIILIKRSTTGIGDLLMVTPSIKALKEKYPDKEIHVACLKETWPVLQSNPDVDKILDVNDSFNYKRYFMVIDISNPCARYESTRILSGKQVQKSRVEIFAEAVGVRDGIRKLKPYYEVTDKENKWASDFIEQASVLKKPKIAIGVSSAEIYRNWPESKYQTLFNLLSKNFETVILNNSREYAYENVIDARGFPLRKAVAILSNCQGLITVDTSYLHFGAALDIPTVALFGPIDCKPRCKGYDNVTVIKPNLDCVPCWRNSKIACKRTGFIKDYSKCMSLIGPKQVAEIAIDKFKGNL